MLLLLILIHLELLLDELVALRNQFTLISLDPGHRCLILLTSLLLSHTLHCHHVLTFLLNYPLQVQSLLRFPGCFSLSVWQFSLPMFELTLLLWVHRIEPARKHLKIARWDRAFKLGVRPCHISGRDDCRTDLDGCKRWLILNHLDVPILSLLDS